MLKRSIISALALMVFAGTAESALTVTSDDFSAGGTVSASNFLFGVNNWGEANTTSGSYVDFLLTTTSSPSGPVGGTGFTPGIDGAGYLYREVGTRDTFTSLNIQGVNYSRPNGAAPQIDTLVIQVYSLPAGDSFAFAESGNDIATAPGASLLGSFNALSSTVSGTLTPFNQNVNISAAASNARLFLRIDDLNPATGIGYVDNLQLALVPEPSAAFLGGMSLLGLIARRRNRTK